MTAGFPGVNSFILVGLERVPQFEEAVLLEYGRGFRYTRPLRVNLMDLDYEILEELVSIICCMYFMLVQYSVVSMLCKQQFHAN